MPQGARHLNTARATGILNPLFIEAGLLTGCGRIRSASGQSLNPLFIEAGLLTDSGFSQEEILGCLNPLFIEAGLLTGCGRIRSASGQSLNPLFIEAGLLTPESRCSVKALIQTPATSQSSIHRGGSSDGVCGTTHVYREMSQSSIHRGGSSDPGTSRSMGLLPRLNPLFIEAGLLTAQEDQ